MLSLRFKEEYFVMYQKGLTKCTANELIQSHFLDCFLGVLYIKKSYHPLFCVCLKNFRTNFTDFHIPGLKGASLFWTWSFFSFSMQVLFRTNSCAEFAWFLIANFFVDSHFLFVMAVSSHCDRLSLRGLFSNFQRYLRKILSRWHLFFFLLFAFLHQSASHNFSLSIELTSKRLIYYNTVVYRLYLAQFVQRQTYNLLHSNLEHFLRTNSPTYEFTYKLDRSTYKFTYLRTWWLFLRIHLLFHAIWCIPIWTTSYLQIPFLTSHLQIHL